jgi:hypothetical protein
MRPPGAGMAFRCPKGLWAPGAAARRGYDAGRAASMTNCVRQ